MIVSSSDFEERKIVSRTNSKTEDLILDSSTELVEVLISLIKMSKIHSN